MTIEFHCPHCDKLLKTPDDKAGVRANCPGCGQTVTIPDASETAAIFDDSFDRELETPAPHGEPATSNIRKRGSSRVAAPATTTACPMCGEQIATGALRCRYCGEELKPTRTRSSGLVPHRGVLILVFGILGWVVCFPFGIAAWVMANHDLGEMNVGRMDDEGRGLTIAGKVLGIVQCCLFGLAVVFYAVVVLITLMAR